MPLAVAALPFVIIALVAMILIWGADLLFKSMLQSMANHVPLIGGALSRAVGQIVDGAVSLASSAARAVIADTIGVLLAPVYWIERHIVSAVNVFYNLVDAVAYITTKLIPDTIDRVETDISTAYHNAVQYTQTVAHLIYAALAYATSELTNALAVAEADLTRYTQALVAAAEAYTTAEISSLTRYVEGEVSALETEITQVAASETRFAQSLYADAVGYAESLVTTAESALVKDITGVVDWTQTQVTALDHAIEAMGTQVIAFTLDAVGTVESDLLRLKEECTDNLCSGLSDAASLANGLMSQVWTAALLGYAAWAVADPVGCGRDTAEVLGPVAAGAADAVNAAVGVL